MIHRPKILIVDDAAANIKMLAEVLRGDYQVVFATEGEKALEICAGEQPPDIVLLDIVMSPMNGYEVCERLKADPKTRSIPVVFLTAKTEEHDETHGFKLGAVDYITKPFSTPRVKSRVHTHLELKRHRDSLEKLVEERTAKLIEANAKLHKEIADRIEAQNALKISEERYRTLVESATDAIFVVQDERIKFPNTTTLERLEITEEDLERKRFIDFVHPEDKNIAGGRQTSPPSEVGEAPSYELRLVTGSGRTVWAEINAVPITWEGREATLTFLRDITKRKSLEARLQKAKKMEALGRLAAGVSHDFNNILSPIIGYTELTKEDLEPGSLAWDNLEEVLSATKRAKSLIRKISTFSSQSEGELEPVDLEAIAKETVKLLRPGTAANIDISLSIAAPLCPVMGDAVQLGRVIMNMGTNAIHAMPHGGRLDIALSRVDLPSDDRFESANLPGGRYVLLEIADTGTGMRASMVDKIFDPFFTTKPKGEGTGLGLSVVSGIVKDYGGEILVSSEPGRGTVFQILLPAVDPKTVSTRSSAPA